MLKEAEEELSFVDVSERYNEAILMSCDDLAIAKLIKLVSLKVDELFH